MKIEPGRLPRRSWSQVAAGCYLGTHFGLIFGPPEPLKIVLSLWYGAIFAKHGMTRPGAPNRTQNDPKIEPQTTPRGLQMAKSVAPRRCSIFKQISIPILTILGSQIGTSNRSKIGLGAKREPRSPRQPPGGPQEPPRRPPGGPQEAPRRPLEARRQTQEQEPKTHPAD